MAGGPRVGVGVAHGAMLTGGDGSPLLGPGAMQPFHNVGKKRENIGLRNLNFTSLLCPSCLLPLLLPV